MRTNVMTVRQEAVSRAFTSPTPWIARRYKTWYVTDSPSKWCCLVPPGGDATMSTWGCFFFAGPDMGRQQQYRGR